MTEATEASGGARPRLFIANRNQGGEQVRVNVRATVNAAAIRREKRNGRDVIIVPSATMPDDIVMNGIRYPADEIGKAFAGLDRTPAPLGHPTINGKFVSARDPEGINLGWIGAWNENARQDGGRVLVDKVIDVERASESAGGRRVLAAIEKGDPVHTSTGLLCVLDAANGEVDYKFTAREIEFDHDAILLDEDGAATPEQGVGMMVNSAGAEIRVVNSALSDEVERELGWAVDQAVRALEKRHRAPLYERIRTALIEAFDSIGGGEREPSQQQNKDADMTVSKEQFDALSAKVDALSEAITPDALTNAVTAAIKPLTDAHEASLANQKAKDDEELAGLVEKIVKANLMAEDAAKELTLNAARALAKTATPSKAAPLNGGGFKPQGDAPSYKLPKAED